MNVDWKWLKRMARKWSGLSRDFPEAEQRAYRASLGLPQTPEFERKVKGQTALDLATRKWFRE